MVFALLPPALGLVLFLASAAVLGALIGLLTRSRLATEAEFRVMAAVLAELGGGRVDVGSPGPASCTASADAGGVGDWALSGGHHAGPGGGDLPRGVSGGEAVAVLADAVGRRRATRLRLETAVLAATTPWRMEVATFRGVGRAFAWLRFMRSDAGRAGRRRGPCG